MKRLLVFISTVYFFSFFSFGQYSDYKITSLIGLEDSSGGSILFYRAGSDQNEYNSFYRLNISTQTDTFFLEAFRNFFPTGEISKSIYDLEFFNNNPNDFIYCGEMVWPDNHAYIMRNNIFGQGGVPPFSNVEISKQNPLRVFASVNGSNSLLSVDGGYSWSNESFINFFLISLSPYDEKTMFGMNNHHLVKSLDTGNSYTEVDTATWNGNSRFYYDIDGTHIYGCSSEYDGSSFVSVSDKNGDAFSWKKIWESGRKVFISVDQSLLVGPLLYLADGKYIYLSSDYGKTFSHYRKLDRNIVGIYKKPFTNFLYAATKYNLYEITSNETKIIKSLPISPETLSYYPLAVGNKWNFNIFRREYMSVGWRDDEGIMTREVTGDTLLPNGKKYFIIKQKESLFSPTWDSINLLERIDSTTGKVFRYDSTSDISSHDLIIEDLTAEIGDTLELSRYPNSNTQPQVIYQTTGQKYFGDQILDRKIYHFPNSLYYTNYSLTREIGLDSLSADFDFGYRNYWLKGCVIIGKVMGDTSLVVGIKDENSDVPSEFSLSQNYPNPFNPETVINYQLAVNSKVSLKVYDVLGNEVAVLVNEEKPAGKYQVNFNAQQTTNNQQLTSGVYFYRLQAGNFVQTKKFILMK